MTDVGRTITVTCHVRAPPEDVYAAWTDPAGYARWFDAQRIIVRPEVDGLWFVETSWEGRRWPHYGRFLRLEAPRLVEHTWVSEATRGTETVLTLSLAPRGGGTDLVLTHAGFPDEETARQHEQGWQEILTGFAAKMSRGGAGY